MGTINVRSVCVSPVDWLRQSQSQCYLMVYTNSESVHNIRFQMDRSDKSV